MIKKTILSIVTSLAIANSAMAMENKVYVVVNGENITQQDVSIAIRDPRVNFTSLPQEQQKKILNTLVEQKLLSQYAYDLNIPNTSTYKIELAKLKKTLALQVWVQDLSKKIKVKESDIKSFYDINKNKFQSAPELKASHILVKTLDEANSIIKELSKSSNMKKDFTALAKTKSTGPSGANGGELGWFTKDKMVPEFSNAALKLKKGEITKTAIKTQFGYHIIYLDDKKAASTIGYNEIKAKLHQDLLQQKFTQTVQKKAIELKKKAKIEYK